MKILSYTSLLYHILECVLVSSMGFSVFNIVEHLRWGMIVDNEKLCDFLRFFFCIKN